MKCKNRPRLEQAPHLYVANEVLYTGFGWWWWGKFTILRWVFIVVL